jgi:perosamine synthetase
VQTRRFFYPIHWQPPYKKLVKGTFPNSEWLYAHGLSLPSSVTLTDEQIEEVCGKVLGFARQKI